MAEASAEFRQPDLHPSLTAAHDGLFFHQFMLAGSAAGVVEHTAMFPVDTLKTLIQTHSRPCQSPPSLAQAIRSLPSALSLYRGLSAMALGAAPAHAVYFSVYELSKEHLSQHNPNPNLAPLVHASSGVLATVSSDAVLTPMDTVKQRLQLRESPYRGVLDCVGRVLRDEGLGALFRSYRTTVVMNAPFTAVHFATYEAAKRVLTELSVDIADDGKIAVHATAGAVGGALAAAVSTPLDVVKTQLQCQGVCGCMRFSSNSIWEVIKVVVKRDGYAGLMRGWVPRMLFHAPAAAICWSTYEAAKSFFKDLNDRNIASSNMRDD
ncbi:putative uncharacterized mitochondrial carrier C8C9.12c [Iris pallida]|uniref:Uncharacterized mitochondrial carrier C8C9.12c n=1 Tax=Iris pallida TaxID=29817 RepID=A0AAX6HSY9_IRIPA|nr:putative uncharacterized mitochondrial carrier C8C9.12c [Iris pallida]